MGTINLVPSFGRPILKETTHINDETVTYK